MKKVKTDINNTIAENMNRIKDDLKNYLKEELTNAIEQKIEINWCFLSKSNSNFKVQLQYILSISKSIWEYVQFSSQSE